MKQGAARTSWKIAAGVVGTGFLLSGPLGASERALPVARGVDVPEVWSADQHVYVKGNLGVGDAQLAGLEQWIDQHAPNWTVVLLANAAGEQFTEAGGRTHRGMDAVEFALGQGLPNRTAFGELKHPQTGEANGAFFVLFLEERKLTYFGSDAYDKRNLGEDRWQGNLDNPAIRAMRGGGRIVDAAKDTIANIDSQFARKLAADEAQRKQAAERARRQQEETAALIEQAGREIEVAANRARELAAELGQPGRDLVRPDLNGWRTALQQARRLHEAGQVAEAGTIAQSTRELVLAFLRSLDAHATAPRDLAALQKSLEATAVHDQSNLARTRLAEARNEFESAQDAHARADSSYRAHLDRAAAALAAAESASAETAGFLARRAAMQGTIDSTTLHPRSTDARRLLDAAREALAGADRALEAGEHDLSAYLADAGKNHREAVRLSMLQQQREERRRAALTTGGIVGAASLLLLGVLGNRRRCDERAEAQSLLASWEQTLKGKLDGLFDLMERATIQIGSAADLDERGYSGETLRLARRTIRDVDELFIMSSCVDSIFDRAAKLVRPGNPPARAVNLISASRYLKAVRLLRDEPVRFEAGDHLRAIVTGRPADRPGLLGRPEDYEPFTLSFKELVAAFDERAKRALETLELIETSWETIPSRLASLQQEIAAAETARDNLGRPSPAGSLFLLARLFEQLLPAAQERHDAAVEMGASDPVQAIAGPLRDGERIVSNGTALLDLAVETRTELAPSLERSCTGLEAAGRRTDWVDAALSAGSQTADELSHAAIASDQAESIAHLERRLGDLGQATAEALDIEKRVATELHSGTDEAARLIDETRRSLGAALNVSPDSVLRERGADPSQRVEAAREACDIARNFLDRGDIPAARQAAARAHELIEEATGVVTDTRRVHEEFAGVAERASKELDDLRRDLPGVAQIAGKLAANFAPSALSLGPAQNGAQPADTRTTDQVLATVRNTSDTAAQQHRDAQALFEQARHLEAADTLDRCLDGLELCRLGLQQIRAHDSRLADTARENREQFERLEARHTACRELADQFHVTEQTRGELATASGMLDDLRLPAAGAGLDDPFTTQAALEALAERFDSIEAGAAGDKLLYEEALRSIEAAGNELAAARSLAHQARNDRVPDSAQITHGLAGLDALDPALQHLQTRLGSAHENWSELDDTADRIASDARRFAATLRGELRRAETAAAALTAAMHETHRATGWFGGLGVAIAGSPGTSQLAQARALLQAGDYLAAHRAADDARRVARSAIDHAEAEVRRRKRAAQRRRQQSSSGLLGSGSSSRFGSSIGSSRASSGFGSSRSSFSSGSGTRRSGW